MRIVATVDVGEVTLGFKAMQLRGDRLGPAFERLKKPLRDDQIDHAREQSGPDGKWPKRKMLGRALERDDKGWLVGNKLGRKIKGRKRRSRLHRRRQRKLLGKLPGAMKYGITPDSVYGRSRVDWSGIHMDGGRAGHGATIPQRQFLWLSPDILRVAEAVLSEHILEGWEEAPKRSGSANATATATAFLDSILRGRGR